jgi:cell division protein FtsN
MSISNRKRQRGGTVLGLILGLIIGLAIAVVVAIMIKTTPLPFINKVGRPDAAASTPVVDPNKGMRGNRDPAREAAKQSTKPAEEAKPAEPAVAAKDAAKDAAKEATRGDKPSEGKAPVVEKSAPADRLAKLDPAPAGDEKFTYYLQAGAFLEQADAENTKARLALMGVAANIAERKSDNGTLFRVRIGPFAQQEAMNRVRGKLTDNGVDVAVVRLPK